MSAQPGAGRPDARSKNQKTEAENQDSSSKINGGNQTRLEIKEIKRNSLHKVYLVKSVL